MNSKAFGIFTCTWIGLIIGVSFIATPAKFLSPSLSLPDALEVGRATFGVFRWVDLLMMLVIIVLQIRQRSSNAILACVVILVALLCAQYLVLLPILDNRVAQIVSGAPTADSNMHMLYIGVELSKIAILGAICYYNRQQI